MSGRSGAEITVTKTGRGVHARRVYEQGRWLWHREHTNLVRVFEYDEENDGSAWYTMEYLDPLVSSPVNRTEQIIEALRNAVWKPIGSCTNFSPTYVAELRTGIRLLDWFRRLQGTLDDGGAWESYETHGDPTFENAMRRGEDIVLIDPLPDVTRVGRLPALRALDLGKILQSGLGYERVRAGTQSRPTIYHPVFNVVRRACQSPLEWKLACWFCAVHVARLIPYQDGAQRVIWEDNQVCLNDSLRSISTAF